MQKFTYLLLVLVLGTLGLSVIRHPVSNTVAAIPQKDPDRYKRIIERFPTAEYNEPDLFEPEKNAKKKDKQKRYNDGRLVSTSPPSWQTESVFIPEGIFAFPALPVAQSDIVVVGTVGIARAHLSESKKNVFSEFTLVVDNVLKSSDSKIVQNSVLTVDRIGGHVKYPNGQRILFRISGLNMPQPGMRYLMFLSSRHKKEDLSILTAYELTENGVVPLDESSQFDSLTGISEAELVRKVRDLLQNPSN